MSPHLRVLEPGLQTTVQDLGRIGRQHLGVPVSGALDAPALRLANALVGNPEGTAGLEIRLMGPTLEVAAESVRVALAGSAGPLEVLGRGTVALPGWQSLTLRRGQRVRVAALRDGACAYLAVAGGLDLPALYDSLSTTTRVGIGGLEGRALRAGDRLPLVALGAAPRPELSLPRPPADPPGTAEIRVVLGPQADYFTAASLERFLAVEYRVSRDADRMGIRLEGPALEHARGHDIVSDAIVTGSVQVPGNGRPIILLADHQTTGGYPKVATVASADLPRLGRMRPGDAMRFRAVAVAEAEAARRDLERAVRRLAGSLRPAPAWLDADALYEENLIGGVVG